MKPNRLLNACLRASLLVLTGGLLVLAGCGDEEGLTPHDQLTLTPDEAAGQSGYLAWAMAMVAPRFLENTNKIVDTITFSGNIDGSCSLELLTAPGGTPATGNAVGYGHMWTVPGDPLRFNPIATGNESASIILAFSFEAAITQGTPDRATVNGLGSIGNEAFMTRFELDALEVAVGGDHPSGGAMTVEVGPYTADIEFDGGNEAMMTLDGVTYFIDLETGETTAAVPTF